MTGDDALAPEGSPADATDLDPERYGVAEPDARAAPSAGDDLVLLSNDGMRARRRPLAIVLFWAWQFMLASVVALPTAETVAGWYGKHPSGDAPLWTPGAHALLDLLITMGGARSGLLTLFAVGLALSAFAELWPLASLIAAMGYATRARRPPPLRATLARGLRAFPSFVSLFLTAAVAEGFAVGLAVFADYGISNATERTLGEARADQLGWLAAAALLLVAAIVGVVHDLARTAVVRFQVSSLRAWGLGWTTFARNPIFVTWWWAWRALAGWAPVVIGAMVASKLGGRGGAALGVLAIVHQLVALSRVAFRASWLATALRVVDRTHRVVRR